MHALAFNQMAAVATTEALCSYRSHHNTPQHLRPELVAIEQHLHCDVAHWIQEGEERRGRTWLDVNSFSTMEVGK